MLNFFRQSNLIYFCLKQKSQNSLMPELHHGYCTFTVHDGTNLVPAFVEVYVDQVKIGMIGINTASYISKFPKYPSPLRHW